MAKFQFVAFWSGVQPSSSQMVSDETLHDVFHSLSGYGVSEFEEMQGDHHTTQMVNHISKYHSVFRERVDAPKIRAVINEGYRQLFALDFSHKILGSLYSTTLDSVDFQGRRSDPSKVSPTAETAEMFAQFKAKGFTTRLNAQQLNELKAAFYDGWGGSDSSYLAIVARYTQHKDYKLFQEELEVWAEAVGDWVRPIWEAQFMSQAQFEDHALRAAAGVILVERTSPGWINFRGGDTFFNHIKSGAIESVDLRTAFPAVLKEVQERMARP